MNQPSSNKQSCFQLLQSVLLEAFQTEVLYFAPPYKNLEKIDRGIRNIMWPNYYHTDSRLVPSKEYPERRFFVIRSNLGFYNILIYLTIENHPEFISIGPFRSEEFSIEYLPQLIKDMHVSSGTFNVLTQYYKGLPYVPLLAVVNVTKHIMDSFYPEFQSISPIYVEFSEQTHELQIDHELLLDYSADYAETYQKHLLKLLEAIKKGDSDIAHNRLKEFLTQTKILTVRNISECKKNLLSLNDHFHIALLETHVHPTHILKLYVSLRTKIENLTSRDAVLSMPNDMCHKYCLLIKNYAFPEYSKTIRSIINYIYLHLDEDLSLSILAKHFHKNAASLSSSFTKEVGINITNFIHQTRINEAIRFFNTTKMSVSDVALAVGFQDFAYFSRLFKKQIGCSPREYCKSIKQ